MSAYIYICTHTLADALVGALALGWVVTMDGRYRDLVAPDGRGWRCLGAAQQWAALRAGGVVPGGHLDRWTEQDAADCEAAYREHRGLVVSETVVAETFAGTDVDFDDTIPDGVLSDAGQRQALGA